MSTARKQEFKILNCTVLESLGEGGMGAVHRGVHEKVGQQVAVKIMDPMLAKNQELRERFFTEARTHLALRHLVIVQLLTADMEGDQVCLILELVRCLSLDQVLVKRGFLPVDKSLKIFTQVFSALGYAHKRQVIHRDIKPSNLIMEADGTTRITDFGIAKVLGDIRLTKTGTAMGSAAYMSPEQVLGNKDIDHRTDIYSLGVAFFEVLTGNLPFGGRDSNTESDFFVKKAHVEKNSPDASSLRSEIPQYLSSVIKKAMSKDPRQRFHSCEEFLTAIHSGIIISGSSDTDQDLQCKNRIRRKHDHGCSG